MAGTELAVPSVCSQDKARGDRVKMAMGGPGSQSKVNEELPGPGLILKSPVWNVALTEIFSHGGLALVSKTHI